MMGCPTAREDFRSCCFQNQPAHTTPDLVLGGQHTQQLGWVAMDHLLDCQL